MPCKNCTDGICNNLCSLDVVQRVATPKSKDGLNKAIVNFLLELKDLEKESNELVNSKPEYKSYFQGQSTGIMRARVSLEVLIERYGLRHATVVDESGTEVDGEIVFVRSDNG